MLIHVCGGFTKSILFNNTKIQSTLYRITYIIVYIRNVVRICVYVRPKFLCVHVCACMWLFNKIYRQRRINRNNVNVVCITFFFIVCVQYNTELLIRHSLLTMIAVTPNRIWSMWLLPHHINCLNGMAFNFDTHNESKIKTVV